MNTTIFGISKTTIEGWLSFLISTLTFVAGYQGLTALMNPQATKVWLFITVIATFVVGLLQLWLRMVQGDGTANLAATPTTPSTNTAGKVSLIILCLLIPACLLSACNDWERTTYQALSASKSLIDQAGVDYNSGTIAKTAANQAIITQARNAQTAAVDAMAAYEEIKFSAPTNATGLSTQQAAVEATLVAIVPLVAQIKALYATKTSMLIQPERISSWTQPPFRMSSPKFSQTRMPSSKQSESWILPLNYRPPQRKVLSALSRG